MSFFFLHLNLFLLKINLFTILKFILENEFAINITTIVSKIIFPVDIIALNDL